MENLVKQLVTTGDGSHTLHIPKWNVNYHSSSGAIQESRHVYIKGGLLHSFRTLRDNKISIFEMGFGTGLNALLTFIESGKQDIHVYYETLELYPLNEETYLSFNFCRELNRPDLENMFKLLHTAEWNKPVAISPQFTLFKKNQSLLSYTPDQNVCLIYFDAFAPAVQPELWTPEIFQRMFHMTEPGGILVTYSSKGEVKRALRAAGYTTEKIPGSPPKREMLRAIKPPG